MKIYTRTGDKGQTSLFNGQRIRKDNEFIKTLGAIDECNCAIGLSISHLPSEPPFDELKKQLEMIQHALFDIGAAIATPRTRSADDKIAKTRFDKEAISMLEEWMDTMETSLNKLHTFILPGGHPSGAHLHLARSICRRAETKILPLLEHADVSEDLLVYVNRLSDYLFMASRYANHLLKRPETFWEPHKMHR